MILFFLFLFFLCWGSFLNVVAFRLASNASFFRTRSYCPHCDTTLAWYDNIPVISWFMLQGKCRTCTQPISWLYPVIEVAAAFIFTYLTIHTMPEFTWHTHVPSLHSLVASHFLSYFVFFSALLVCVRTDLEILMVPRFFTLWLVPVGFLLSWFGYTHISWWLSAAGAIAGYGITWFIDYLFHRATAKRGIGQGDMEMLAMIGSFLGPWGAWISLLVGSMIGTFVGGIYLWFMGASRETRLPFGPFLALGAALFFFYQDLISFLLS